MLALKTLARSAMPHTRLASTVPHTAVTKDKYKVVVVGAGMLSAACDKLVIDETIIDQAAEVFRSPIRFIASSRRKDKHSTKEILQSLIQPSSTIIRCVAYFA